MKKHSEEESGWPVIPAAAFSGDGFIIDQQAFAGVRFGRRYSDYNGCGWMAAYNLLHALHLPDDWKSVVCGMRHHTLLFGELGTNPFGLRRFLKKRGIKVRLSFRPRTAARLADEDSDGGIVMYWHGHGAHFVAFARAGAGLRFFNARRRDPAHYGRMADFIPARSKFPLVVMLTVVRRPDQAAK